MKGSPLRRLCALGATVLLAAALRIGPAVAEEPAEGWRSEFEAVCVKTDLAMSLSSEELGELVARCDRLAERIGAEAEIVRKVYLKRLGSCRALFVYVLETRGAAAAGGGGSAPPPQAPAATPPDAEAQPVPGEAAPPPEVKPAP